MGHKRTRLPGVASSLVWVTEEEVVHVLPSRSMVRFVAGTDQVVEMCREAEAGSRGRGPVASRLRPSSLWRAAVETMEPCGHPALMVIVNRAQRRVSGHKNAAETILLTPSLRKSLS